MAGVSKRWRAARLPSKLSKATVKDRRIQVQDAIEYELDLMLALFPLSGLIYRLGFKC